MGTLERFDLAKYRLEMAEKKLNSARLLFEQGFLADAQSRAYYCLLHSARALLATRQLDSRKHSGVISLFNQHFVKNKVVPKHYGKILMNAKDLREDSDYDEFYVTSRKETEELLNQASEFLAGIRNAVRNIAENSNKSDKKPEN